MTGYQERRGMHRIAVSRSVQVRARGTIEGRLIDLSLTGARVEHLGLLRPGYPCVLEFPVGLGRLILASHIVRSAVVGVERTTVGERHLKYQSGLAFAEVTGEQGAALADIMDGLSH